MSSQSTARCSSHKTSRCRVSREDRLLLSSLLLLSTVRCRVSEEDASGHVSRTALSSRSVSIFAFSLSSVAIVNEAWARVSRSSVSLFASFNEARAFSMASRVWHLNCSILASMASRVWHLNCSILASSGIGSPTGGTDFVRGSNT